MNLGDVCSYTFYFLLNMVTISLLLTLNDNFFKDYSPVYIISLFSFCSIAYVLLITTKNSPGILQNTNFSTIINTSPTQSSSETEQSISPHNKMVSFPIQNCDKCNNISLPLRSHHCSRCGVCIRGYDHHCGMIGGCIGEENHFKFIMFCLTQAIALILSISGLLMTLSELLNKNKEQYLNVPFAIYVLIFILGCYCLFASVLFGFHSYLTLTNQTTFEIFHREKCDYLVTFKEKKIKIMKERGKELPPSFMFHPFDMGLINNIKCLFKITKWEDVYMENLKANVIPFNCCENQYWSCF